MKILWWSLRTSRESFNWIPFSRFLSFVLGACKVKPYLWDDPIRGEFRQTWISRSVPQFHDGAKRGPLWLAWLFISQDLCGHVIKRWSLPSFLGMGRSREVDVSILRKEENREPNNSDVRLLSITWFLSFPLALFPVYNFCVVCFAQCEMGMDEKRQS